MNAYHVEVTQDIPAPAERIYAVIADYQTGHPAILPKPYFTSLTVEQGGYGAGTVVLVHMNVMGAKRSLRLETSEPQPGRELVETDPENGVVTRFLLAPLDENHTRVTITSDVQTGPGFSGFLERLLTPPITRRIYRAELDLLAAYLQR